MPSKSSKLDLDRIGAESVRSDVYNKARGSKMWPAITFLAERGKEGDPFAEYANQIVQGYKGSKGWNKGVNFFADKSGKDVLKHLNKNYNYRPYMEQYRRMTQQIPSVVQANKQLVSRSLGKRIKGQGRKDLGPGYRLSPDIAGQLAQQQRNMARRARRDYRQAQGMAGGKQYRGVWDVLNQFVRGDKSIQLRDILRSLLGQNPRARV